MGGIIYIYIHMCVLIVVLLLNPGIYLEQFCHHKRSQTFANETGSGFKIQDSNKTS